MLLTCLLPFLATNGSRVLEKKVSETHVSKTVFSHLNLLYKYFGLVVYKLIPQTVHVQLACLWLTQHKRQDGGLYSTACMYSSTYFITVNTGAAGSKINHRNHFNPLTNSCKGMACSPRIASCTQWVHQKYVGTASTGLGKKHLIDYNKIRLKECVMILKVYISIIFSTTKIFKNSEIVVTNIIDINSFSHFVF